MKHVTMTVLAGLMCTTLLWSCTKDEVEEAQAGVILEPGEPKVLGGRFINGLNGWDGFDVSNAVAELGEFEANIDNTGRCTIRTEGVGGMRVGDGGNYPTGICDGPVPNQGGFRFTKGSTATTCGATYYLTPRRSGANGQCLKLRIKGGVLPALPSGQSWFTCGGVSGTWTAHALASTFMCWSTQAIAPTPLCE